ncbi:MAG TPA: hypothetical protein PKX16_05035, partial [Kiritimatiellia bacterium]|nr:hypothetical protein [Kiritimatiellia bacterium]
KRLRLRALTACGGRRFPGHSAGRALRLTRGAACSAQQPRRTARKPPKTALNPSFPHCGNIFSIVWKNPENFFHCVEKTAKVFPLCGKIAESFSIAWKKWACFSTVWKIFFHSVEKSRKSFPYCGKLYL